MSHNRLLSLLRKTKSLWRSKAYRVSNESSYDISRIFFSKSKSSGDDHSFFRRDSYLGMIRSLYKEFSCSSSRKMSSTMSHLSMMKKETTKVGLKLLVTEKPGAQKMVGIWLFGSALWVFSMVVIGGITRLSRFDLSMSEWTFTGQVPPLSKEEWLEEFEKYQQSPRSNKVLSMEDFKFIFWMEYVHRIWERGLAVVFAMPYTYFLAKGYITRHLGLRLSSLFALGAGPGLLGWWMDRNVEDAQMEHAQTRVSPYRSASHFTSTFAIYCGLLWTALSVIMPEPPTGSMSWVHGAAKVRRLALPITALVGITVISGGYVASNDAGRVYNTFPKMGNTWVPENILSMRPVFRNFFENISTVQFDHRILAAATLISIGGLWCHSWKLNIHPALRSAINGTMTITILQVMLGITVLLSEVPISLASIHQIGAMTLMTFAILLTHIVRKPSPALLKSLASLRKSR